MHKQTCLPTHFRRTTNWCMRNLACAWMWLASRTMATLSSSLARMWTHKSGPSNITWTEVVLLCLCVCKLLYVCVNGWVYGCVCVCMCVCVCVCLYRCVCYVQYELRVVHMRACLYVQALKSVIHLLQHLVPVHVITCMSLSTSKGCSKMFNVNENPSNLLCKNSGYFR